MASIAYAILGMQDKNVTKTLMTASLMHANTIPHVLISIWLVNMMCFIFICFFDATFHCLFLCMCFLFTYGSPIRMRRIFPHISNKWGTPVQQNNSERGFHSAPEIFLRPMLLLRFCGPSRNPLKILKNNWCYGEPRICLRSPVLTILPFSTTLMKSQIHSHLQHYISDFFSSDVLRGFEFLSGFFLLPSLKSICSLPTVICHFPLSKTCTILF